MNKSKEAVFRVNETMETAAGKVNSNNISGLVAAFDTVPRAAVICSTFIPQVATIGREPEQSGSATKLFLNCNRAELSELWHVAAEMLSSSVLKRR